MQMSVSVGEGLARTGVVSKRVPDLAEQRRAKGGCACREEQSRETWHIAEDANISIAVFRLQYFDCSISIAVALISHFSDLRTHAGLQR